MKDVLTRRFLTTGSGRNLEYHMIVDGPKGSVQFHFSVVGFIERKDLWLYENYPYQPWGVEQHKRVEDGEKADHETCWLLGGRCAHDGTSLYASRTVMPAFINGGADAVWPLLEGCYESWFRTEGDA